jgi:two-component system cell cycle response regulator DivK
VNTPAENPRPVVLVVDDLEDNRDLLTQWLERYEFQVVTAASAMEAFEHLDSVSVDLILLDIQMPTMDGFEFLRRLRGHDQFRCVPVICITAHYKEPSHIARGLTFASGYFTKPFAFHDLLMKIEVVLQTRRPTELIARMPWEPPPPETAGGD